MCQRFPTGVPRGHCRRVAPRPHQPSTAESPDPATFILATDQRLAELGKITLDFDVSRVDQLSQPLEGLGERSLPE